MSEKKGRLSARALQDNAEAERLLQQKEFRRWFLRIMETSGMRQDTFQLDPYANAYTAGKVALGTEALQSLLDADPRARLLLEQERLTLAMETESAPRERNPDRDPDAEL